MSQKNKCSLKNNILVFKLSKLMHIWCALKEYSRKAQNFGM